MRVLLKLVLTHRHVAAMADDLYVIEVLVAELDVVGGDVVELLVAEVDVVGWGVVDVVVDEEMELAVGVMAFLYAIFYLYLCRYILFIPLQKSMLSLITVLTALLHDERSLELAYAQNW